MMNEVSEGDIDAIVRPMVLLYHTDKIEIPELAHANTNSAKILQDNGAIPPVITQPFLPQSPLWDT